MGELTTNPDWLYYLTPSHLDVQAGYALVHAGTLAADDGDRSAGRLCSAGEMRSFVPAPSNVR